MTWWTITAFQCLPAATACDLALTTNHADHLYAAWSYHKPSRHPIWRVIRGKRIQCGYRYIWDTPTIEEQTEPGDTLTHSISLGPAFPLTRVWFYVFAPAGPYGLEIQGPLLSCVTGEAPAWPTTVIVGTRAKGVYYSDSFTAPGEPNPVWTEINDNLHSLAIWQLESDPLGANYRLYSIAGTALDRIVYCRTPSVSNDWIPILTSAQCAALAGVASGTIAWVSANLFFPGELYVHFKCPLNTTGFWCIRSLDYGLNWTGHQISNVSTSYEAGNLVPGLAQGTSPYDPGSVLYAMLNPHTITAARVYRSLDHGQTWAYAGGYPSAVFIHRCHVDPTDQSIIYYGVYRNYAHTHELIRSTLHGATPAEIDGPLHLGIAISAYPANMWVNPLDHEFLMIIQDDTITTSSDFALTWDNHGPLEYTAEHLTVLWENPTNLCLTRWGNAPAPPSLLSQHVIFVSTDWGATMDGKAGANCHLPAGGADSIPYNCGGVSLQGTQLFPP